MRLDMPGTGTGVGRHAYKPQPSQKQQQQPRQPPGVATSSGIVDIYDPLLMQHLRNVQHVYRIPRHQRTSFLRHLLLRFADPALPAQSYPYDVTVTRRENEGFGFVIISSVTRAGSVIGKLLAVTSALSTK